jgi:hypothetical protein
VNLTVPRSADEGQVLHLSASVRNDGSPGTATLLIYVDDEVLTDLLLFLDPGESRVVTTNWTAQPGSHKISAVLIVPPEDPGGNESLHRTLNVAPIPPVLELAEVALSPIDPSPGEAVTVTVMITNTGSTPANATVSFYMGDRLISSRSVRVDAHGTSFAVFGWNARPGTHRLAFRITSSDPPAELKRDYMTRTLYVPSRSEPGEPLNPLYWAVTTAAVIVIVLTVRTLLRRR